jgi:hypothetical protein
MRTLALRFRLPGPGDFPGPGVSYAAVETCTRSDAEIVSTPRCMTLLSEIQEELARLRSELDEIEAEAKSEYGSRRG